MIMACQPGINYKYQEFPQHVICDGLDQELMHEAIYSFQDDIGQYYNQYSDYQKGSKSYYIEAYAQFVYFGFSGTAAFYDIVSPHSQAILAKLAQEKELWQMVGFRFGHLLDNHAADACLVKQEAGKAVMAVVFMLVGKLKGERRAAAALVTGFGPDASGAYHDVPVTLWVWSAMECALYRDQRAIR